MTNKIIAIFLSLFLVSSLFSQTIELQPTPHHVEWKSQQLAKPEVFRLNGENQADKYAVNQLKQSLNFSSDRNAFPIYIGKSSDRAVRKYGKNVPNRPEAYYLSIEKDKIIVVGADDRGTFYGVQTLLQLLQQETMHTVEIKDYPDVKSRGVVEGFYGTPWSTQDRLRHIEFYGKNKLNTYIYGPKDDPYHSSPNWRKPYPEKESQEIKLLVDKAKENHVDFVWALHPGKDIQWNEQDRDSVMQKFEKMYDLGVRAFAVFFDDISGEGTKADKQAELLNYLDNNFIKKKKDVIPLIMCPTEYNKSWSDVEKGYLPTLGNLLNPTIEIMWTGDRVIANIDKQSLEWINPIIKRKAYIWWNFPVSDYVRDHLLLGEAYGLDNENGGLMSGIMSNPMEFAESSKVAIYSVADYAWNIGAYDSHKAWLRAQKDVMPFDTDAFHFFSLHNSDLGPNGHRFRRVESVDFKPVADKFLADVKNNTYTTEDLARVGDEFFQMVASANTLLHSEANPVLRKEIKPWLMHFQAQGMAGVATVSMLSSLMLDKKSDFKARYELVKHYKTQMYEIDRTYNQNPFQPGVKTASLVIAPLIDSLFQEATNKYNAMYGENLSAVSEFNPHSLYTNNNQLANQPLRLNNRTLTVSPLLEVLKWEPNDYVGIAFAQPIIVKEIKVNLGETFPDWCVIEISADGNSWKSVQSAPSRDNTFQWARPEQTEVKFIRLRNSSNEEQTGYFRLFEVLTM